MGLWAYPIPEGGIRMTLIELSMKMSKTAPAKTYTFHTDWKKCCIFQEEKNEDLLLHESKILLPSSCISKYGYPASALDRDYISC